MDSEEKACRICLEGGDESNNTLIAPCRCKGTSKWVHRECLDQWRANHSDGLAFSQCTECLFDYHLEYVGDTEKVKIAKYWWFVWRDICLLTVIAQLVVALLGLSVWAIDREGSLSSVCSGRGDICAVAVYYACGLGILIVSLGIHGTYVYIKNDCSYSESIREYQDEEEGRSQRRQRSSDDDCCGRCCADCCSSCSFSSFDCEVCMIGIAILLVLVGFVVAIVVAIVICQRVLKKHMFRRYKRRLVEDFRVKDLSQSKHDLEQNAACHVPDPPNFSSETADDLKKLGLME